MKKCEADPKLPCRPDTFYVDFPGYTVFLGGEKKEFYSTWQKAGKAAGEIGISGQPEYVRRYKQDPKLCRCPNEVYKDFPGWRIFLGTEFYSTWQEAIQAAKKLGISNLAEYNQKYRQDRRLPSSLYDTYKDFPGWRKLSGKEK